MMEDSIPGDELRQNVSSRCLVYASSIEGLGIRQVKISIAFLGIYEAFKGQQLT